VRTAAEDLEVAVPDDLGEGELEQLVASLLDGHGAGQRLRELVRTQGDWLASLNDPQAAEPMFLPTQSVVAGTCMGFLANPHIQNMQFDLCIIDEASRATAPELFVPMTWAKRWVMVGDTKQLPPMVEEVFEHRDLVDSFDLDKMFLTSSLFDILLGEAPEPCMTGLVTQHRMAEPIGELVLVPAVVGNAQAAKTAMDGASKTVPSSHLASTLAAGQDRVGNAAIVGAAMRVVPMAAPKKEACPSC
jgi:hypothetical protein